MPWSFSAFPNQVNDASTSQGQPNPGERPAGAGEQRGTAGEWDFVLARDPGERAKAAGSLNLSEPAATFLARDPEDAVRIALAENPSLANRTLDILVNDLLPKVRALAGQHPNAQPYHRIIATRSGGFGKNN